MSTNCIKWPIFYFIERKSFSSATYAVFPPKHGPTVETGIYGGPEFSILFVCVFFLPRTGLKSVFEGTVMEVDDDSNLPRSVMKYELEDKERLCAVRLICQVSVCSPSDILPSRIPHTNHWPTSFLFTRPSQWNSRPLSLRLRATLPNSTLPNSTLPSASLPNFFFFLRDSLPRVNLPTSKILCLLVGQQNLWL